MAKDWESKNSNEDSRPTGRDANTRDAHNPKAEPRRAAIREPDTSAKSVGPTMVRESGTPGTPGTPVAPVASASRDAQTAADSSTSSADKREQSNSRSSAAEALIAQRAGISRANRDSARSVSPHDRTPSGVRGDVAREAVSPGEAVRGVVGRDDVGRDDVGRGDVEYKGEGRSGFSARASRTAQLTAAADVLQVLLQNSKSKLSDGFLRWKLEQQWAQVVGSTISAQTLPCAYDRGILFIWVSHPTWMQQLWYFQDIIKNKVNEHMGRKWVTQVRFTLSRRAATTEQENSQE